MKDIMALCDTVRELISYLRASGVEHGKLINFGSYRFQIKKYALSSPSSSLGGKLVSFLLSIFAFSEIFRG